MVELSVSPYSFVKFNIFLEPLLFGIYRFRITVLF